MPSSERRIAANRANALKSTGPKTQEGKEASRANALKHGLSSLVVVPGEEAGAVAARVEWLQDSLAPEGDPLTLILARQVAFLSVQTERAFRYETAMAAERARDAEADLEEMRRTAADRYFGYLGAEPLTHHRRLMGTPEGVDLLIGKLEELAAVGRPGGARWEDSHVTRLELFTGRHVGDQPASRGWSLSGLLVRDDASGLDPAEVPDTDRAGRATWAQAELHRLIDAEIGRLRAHRATLDPGRRAASRAEAPERALIGPDREAQLARRYHLAATRALQRAVDQVRARRRDLRRPSPIAVAAARIDQATRTDIPPMPAPLASFCQALERPLPPLDASRLTIGKPPLAPAPDPVPPPKPPRYTP